MTVQADPDVPPFHYGTHYSAAGVVLFYLIRLEPFTGLSRTLQVLWDFFPAMQSWAYTLCHMHCRQGSQYRWPVAHVLLLSLLILQPDS